MHTKIAGSILVADSGEILLQRRDDKQTISSPGKISVFGGHCNADETWIDAVRRELHEETGLRLPADRFRKLFSFAHEYGDGAKTSGCFYVVDGIDKEALRIQEGTLLEIAVDELPAYMDQMVPTTCFAVSMYLANKD